MHSPPRPIIGTLVACVDGLISAGCTRSAEAAGSSRAINPTRSMFARWSQCGKRGAAQSLGACWLLSSARDGGLRVA